MQDLGTAITPFAINDFADVVGEGPGVGSPYMSGNAALYSNGVVQDLNTLIPADTSLYLATAVSINNSGQIIGDGILPDSSFAEYILTPICDRTQYPISDSDLMKNEHWCKAAKGILISPFSAEFGDVPVGTLSRPILVHGVNTSGSPIVFEGAEGTGHFDFKNGSCHLKDGTPGLEAGETCSFSVSFLPVSPGEDTGGLSLSTSAGPITFQLDGTGTN